MHLSQAWPSQSPQAPPLARIASLPALFIKGFEMVHLVLASKWTQYHKLTTKVKTRSRIFEEIPDDSLNNGQQPDFSELLLVVDI